MKCNLSHGIANAHFGLLFLFLVTADGKLLYLKRGDTLIVALTEANSRNGSVCPAEIARLQAKGVRVFLSPSLHAKVVLSGRKLIVGSANLSQSSYSHLDEAAIATTDANTVNHARIWFQQRTIEAITPEWLAVCAKAYRPPKGGMMGGGRKARQPLGKSVWIVRLELEDYPEDEAAVEERGARAARRELSDPTNFKAEPIRWAAKANSFRKGDTIVQVIQEPGSHYVEELSRLIDIRKTKTKRGVPVAYLHLESRKRPKRIPWRKFKQACAAFGLKLNPNSMARNITNAAQAAKMLALVTR